MAGNQVQIIISHIWQLDDDQFVIESAIFVKQRSLFLFFSCLRESDSPRLELLKEEGRLRRAAQSSASLLISYISGGESMCTHEFGELVCEQTYVSDVRISGGCIINSAWGLALYSDEPKLSVLLYDFWWSLILNCQKKERKKVSIIKN